MHTHTATDKSQAADAAWREAEQTVHDAKATLREALKARIAAHETLEFEERALATARKAVQKARQAIGRKFKTAMASDVAAITLKFSLDELEATQKACKAATEAKAEADKKVKLASLKVVEAVQAEKDAWEARLI